MTGIPCDDEVMTRLNTWIEETKSLCQKYSVPEEVSFKLDELKGMLETSNESLEEKGYMAAQVSLYPLRQKLLSPAIEEVLRIFKNQGLELKPGTMSTVITGPEESLWAGLRSAFRAATKRGEAVMLITISNACPRSIHYEDHTT